MCGNDLQGPKGGPAVVLLPHIAADAMAGRARYSGGRKGGADWQALAQTVFGHRTDLSGDIATNEPGGITLQQQLAAKRCSNPFTNCIWGIYN